MIIAVKLPVSGNSSGYCISIDKGTTYHPMVHTNNSIITTHFNQNTILLLMYDGSTKASVYGSSSGATSTSSQNITGVWRVMNSREDGNTYTSAYCSTGATTASKTATSHGYIINNNQKHYIHIIITNTNTAQSALTLNINGQGAKPIYINGTASSSSNYNLTRGSYLAYYDGTNYHFRTDGKLQGSLAGNADTATKLTSSAGSSTQPIYFSNGKPVAITGNIANGTTGNAATATKLQTARTIALTGSVTGSGTFDGSGNLSINTTTNHTHNYAGSSSAGGSATSAVKLDTATAGSQTQPVYFTNGKPSAISYTIAKSVPSNAVFTDINVRQQLYSSNYNLPLLMSYQTNTNTATNVDNVTFRNNNIYANPSTGMIASTSSKIGEHVTLQYDSTNECLNFMFN